MQNLLKGVEAYKQMYDENCTAANEDKISKIVLNSRPPRADDVPDMISYIFKWGGLPSGSFIDTLCEEFKDCVPNDRIVSGNIFKRLASLKYPPSLVPCHFINAVLITHAEASEMVSDATRHLEPFQMLLQ